MAVRDLLGTRHEIQAWPHDREQEKYKATTGRRRYGSMFSVHVHRTLVFPERDKSRVPEMVGNGVALHALVE